MFHTILNARHFFIISWTFLQHCCHHQFVTLLFKWDLTRSSNNFLLEPNLDFLFEPLVMVMRWQLEASSYWRFLPRMLIQYLRISTILIQRELAPPPSSGCMTRRSLARRGYFYTKHNSNICMFVSGWAKINTKGLMWHATNSIQCSMMGNVLTQC